MTAMDYLKRHSSRCVPAALLISAFSSATWAQEGALEEVIVTAERRETLLQDTPISVMNFNAVELEELSIDNFEDLSHFMPNVSIGPGGVSSNTTANYAIRGIGQNRNSIDADRGVGLYIDDMYFARSVNAYLRIADVERIEVLRGPQGTLFGRNNTGGAVRYITRKPVEEFEASIRGTFGDLNRRDIRGVVNVPFSEQVLGRFTYGHFERDGFVTAVGGLIPGQDYGDQDEDILRAQLRFLPSDGLTVDIAASYTQAQNNGPADMPVLFDPTSRNWRNYATNHRGTSVVPSDFFTEPSSFTVPGLDVDSIRENESATVSANITWDVNDVLTFKSMTGWIDVDSLSLSDRDNTPLPINSRLPSMQAGQTLTQEFQLLGTSFDDSVDWVAGLFLLEDDSKGLEASETWLARGMGLSRTENYMAQTAESMAVFVNADWAVTDRISLIGGLRYTQDEKYLESWEVGRGAENGGRVFSNSTDFDDTDWRAVFEYQFTDDIMMYLSGSTAYKGGGVNGGQCDLLDEPTNACILPYRPEHATNNEIGLRSEFLDNRLRLNVTVFDTTYEDMQLIAFSFDTPTGDRIRVWENLDEVDLNGYEIDLTAALTELLTLNIAYGALENRIVKVGEPSTTIQFQVTENSKLAKSPEQTYTAGLRYQRPLESGASMLFRIDYAWRDRIKSFVLDPNSLWVPGYDTVSARARYTSTGPWSASLFCTNCMDKVNYNGGGTAGGTHDYDILPPRHVGLEFTYDF